MPVIFGGRKIIPVQTVDIRRDYIKAENGEILNPVFNIAVNGNLIAYKGSPTSSGTFWTGSDYPPDETIVSNARLKSIERKQEALRQLFSKANEGQTFEIQPWDGGPSQKCNPRILDINFPPGLWVETCPFTINLQADVMYMNGTLVGEDTFTEYISSAKEDWNIQQEENLKTYRLTHNLGAVGKRFYNDDGTLQLEAWQQARDWVLARRGLDSTRLTASGSLDLPSNYNAYNYLRSENVDELGGSYGLVETWVVSSGDAWETFNVETRANAATNLVTVNIQGTVNGLETRNNSTYALQKTRYEAASGYFYYQASPNAFTRAQTYCGFTLNPAALEVTIGRNPDIGVINYTASYDNRATINTAGAVSESVTINDSNPADVFAELPVIGRSSGPVLQFLSTYTARGRQINLELVMPAASQQSPVVTKPSTAALIVSYYPSSYTTLLVKGDEESWNPYTGRYSRNVTLTYEI